MSTPFARGVPFTDEKRLFHRQQITVQPMRDIEMLELVCNRFVAAQEATGLRKGEFARAVGLTPQQFTNISRYRNQPPPKAITAACDRFGFTTDFFYRGLLGGMRDESLPAKIAKAIDKLRIDI